MRKRQIVETLPQVTGHVMQQSLIHGRRIQVRSYYRTHMTYAVEGEWL